MTIWLIKTIYDTPRKYLLSCIIPGFDGCQERMEEEEVSRGECHEGFKVNSTVVWFLGFFVAFSLTFSFPFSCLFAYKPLLLNKSIGLKGKQMLKLMGNCLLRESQDPVIFKALDHRKFWDYCDSQIPSFETCCKTVWGLPLPNLTQVRVHLVPSQSQV
ncbi:unnamed protein product [Lepeophtheirus salmonis]|uniref:(salmon louse) hypothetical protein n=1 Tax=Lepeophtheirus salmonis TaxID=72036 RepID=A0A7R8CNN3_LEPSM|nr:unnamed protein product [Lepeophtheirus salmonis]CAF2843166.1 unnamed protein product [Lepeophtheirus salmonis]